MMKLPGKLGRLFRVPWLTGGRIAFALAVAVVADSVQFLLGPFGWAFVDPAIDVIAMILTTWMLGFHMLLLPTFVIELIPLADMFPTWTACVVAVIVLRKRAQRLVQPPPPMLVTGSEKPGNTRM